jgi:hypothetical protein
LWKKVKRQDTTPRFTILRPSALGLLSYFIGIPLDSGQLRRKT